MDRNNDGDIDVTTDPNTNELLEENNYYPFGLKHEGYNTIVSSNGNQVARKFKYNGMELETVHGVDWYEMDMRQYDPAIARWSTMDPISHYNYSPYQAFDNNPVVFKDPRGANSQSDYNWEEHDKGNTGVYRSGSFEAAMANQGLLADGTVKQMKKDAKKVTRIGQLIKTYEDLLSETDDTKRLKLSYTFYRRIYKYLPKKYRGTSTFTNAQLRILMPIILNRLELIRSSLESRNKMWQEMGLTNDVIYEGAFPGGRKVLEFLRNIKNYRQVYNGNFARFWGTNSKLVVPSILKDFVKDHNTELTFATDGYAPPYEKKSFLGMDFLSPDKNASDMEGYYWFWNNFEKLENYIYSGLKIQN